MDVADDTGYSDAEIPHVRLLVGAENRRTEMEEQRSLAAKTAETDGTVASPAPLRLTRRDALRRAGLASLGVAVLPALQACGGDDDEEEPEEDGAAALMPTTEPPPAASPPPEEAATPPPAAGGEHVVEMNDQLRFDPDRLTIKVGETVTWTTVGAFPHTSTADPDKAGDPDHVRLPEGAERWDSGLVNQGQSFSRTFDVPGEYAYFCIPHEAAGMLATLTVTE